MFYFYVLIESSCAYLGTLNVSRKVWKCFLNVAIIIANWSNIQCDDQWQMNSKRFHISMFFLMSSNIHMSPHWHREKLCQVCYVRINPAFPCYVAMGVTPTLYNLICLIVGHGNALYIIMSVRHMLISNMNITSVCETCFRRNAHMLC